MNTWPDTRMQKLFGIELPIIQAPMANHNNAEMVIAVAKAGGLGSLPCASISSDQIRSEVKKIRAQTSGPINLNFFCHQNPMPNNKREEAWKKKLEHYYLELGLDPRISVPAVGRNPFDESACDLLLELKPEVVSFHFGLPAKNLLDRIKSSGIKIISSATTVDEARFLTDHGCDAIIAQGFEAGGHRAIFQSENVFTQVGTMALVPQIVDAVNIPVIASGGISDSRAIVASLALGAAGVQVGTAYLFSHEATLSKVHREALKKTKDNQTVITNVFTGRPARGIENRMTKEVGPMSDLVPEFPLAGGALAPLKAKTEPMGSGDFMSMWSGQAASLCKENPAEEITRSLAAGALKIIQERFVRYSV